MGPQEPGTGGPKVPKAVDAAQGVQATGQGGGFFNRPMTPEREAAIAELLQTAMQSASQSTSPMANFLAPIAAAIIQNAASSRSDQAASQSQQAMMDAVLGPGVSSDPRAQQLLGILNSEGSPAFLRDRAEQQLEALIAAGVPTPGAAPMGASGGRRSYSGGGSRRYSSGGSSRPSSSSSRTSTSFDDLGTPSTEAPSERRTIGDRLSGIGDWFSDRRDAAMERRNPDAAAEQQRRLNALVNLIPGVNRPTTPGPAPVPQNEDPLGLR
jgi:hypothetical protein